MNLKNSIDPDMMKLFDQDPHFFFQKIHSFIELNYSPLDYGFKSETVCAYKSMGACTFINNEP